MKNLLQNIYIFSKLSISFILIFIIILLIYFFYVSYSSISNQETAETTKNNDLVNSINLNSSKATNKYIKDETSENQKIMVYEYSFLPIDLIIILISFLYYYYIRYFRVFIFSTRYSNLLIIEL